MVNSRHNTLCENLHYGSCKVASVSGRAYLIENNTKFVSFASEFNHCFHEVVSERRVEPCRADNHRVLTFFLRRNFSCKLSASVSRGWRGGAVLVYGFESVSGKHIVCGNLHKSSSAFSYCHGKICGSLAVYFSSLLFFVFRLVHGGICGTIYYCVHFVLLHKGVHGFGVTDVEFCNIGEQILKLRKVFRHKAQFVAQLPVCACYKYLFYIHLHIRVFCCLCQEFPFAQSKLSGSFLFCL